MIASLVRVDMALRTWIVAHRVEWLTGPLHLLTIAGRFGAVWIGVALALAVSRRISWRAAGRVLLSIIVAFALSDYVLKPLINRPRPFVTAPDVPVIGGLPHDASFPSGHATSSFAAATALTSVAPQTALAWWVLAIAIAYSRVYLGVHYPFDVAAGAALGMCIAAAVMRLTRS